MRDRARGQQRGAAMSQGAQDVLEAARDLNKHTVRWHTKVKD